MCTSLWYGCMLSFLLGKCIGMKWCDHMLDIYLLLKKLPSCFPKWMHFTFPPGVYESCCAISLPTFDVGSFLIVAIFLVCIVIYHVVLNCISLMKRWALVHVLIGHLHYFLWHISSNLLLFLKVRLSFL